MAARFLMWAWLMAPMGASAKRGQRFEGPVGSVARPGPRPGVSAEPVPKVPAVGELTLEGREGLIRHLCTQFFEPAEFVYPIPQM